MTATAIKLFIILLVVTFTITGSINRLLGSDNLLLSMRYLLSICVKVLAFILILTML